MNLSQELFQRYAERGDEDAFRELVANYFSLVRSTALRRLQGNSLRPTPGSRANLRNQLASSAPATVQPANDADASEIEPLV